MNYKRYNIFPICNLRLIFSLHFTFQFYTDKKQAESGERAQPCREGGLKQDWLDVAQCIRVQMKQESCREFWPGLKQSRVGWQMKWSKILKFWNVRSQISRPMCKGALFWTFFTRPTSKLSDSFIRILCQNSISDQLSCVRLNFSDKHYTSHNICIKRLRVFKVPQVIRSSLLRYADKLIVLCVITRVYTSGQKIMGWWSTEMWL